MLRAFAQSVGELFAEMMNAEWGVSKLQVPSCKSKVKSTVFNFQLATWNLELINHQSSFRTHRSKMPSVTFVAARAVFEVVAAECSLVVVAARATLRARGRVMHQSDGRCDLTTLRRARAHRVTVGARKPFRRVLRVLEVDAVGRGSLRRARVTSGAVACAARRYVSAGGLRLRRWTAEACRVRVEARRNRERDATAFGLVTRGA